MNSNSTSFSTLSSTSTPFAESTSDEQKAQTKKQKHILCFFNGIKTQINDFQSSEDAQNLEERFQIILENMQKEISKAFECSPKPISKLTVNDHVNKLKSFDNKFDDLLKKLYKLKDRQKEYLSNYLDDPTANKRNSSKSLLLASRFGEALLDSHDTIKKALSILENESNNVEFTPTYNASKTKLEKLRKTILIFDSSSFSSPVLNKLFMVLNCVNPKSINLQVANSYKIHDERLKEFRILYGAINSQKIKLFRSKHLINIIQAKLNLSKFTTDSSESVKLREILGDLSHAPYDLTDYRVSYYTTSFEEFFEKKEDLILESLRIGKQKENLNKDKCPLVANLKILIKSQTDIQTEIEELINDLRSKITMLKSPQADFTESDSQILDYYEEEDLDLRWNGINSNDRQISHQFYEQRNLAIAELNKIIQKLMIHYNHYCLNAYKVKCQSLLFSKLVNIRLNLCHIYLKAREMWQDIRFTRKTEIQRIDHSAAFSLGREVIDNLRNLIHSTETSEIFDTQEIQEIFPEEKGSFAFKDLKSKLDNIDKICVFDFSTADPAVLAKNIGMQLDEDEEWRNKFLLKELTDYVDSVKKSLKAQMTYIDEDYKTALKMCALATYEVNYIGKTVGIESDYYDKDFRGAYFVKNENGEWVQELLLGFANKASSMFSSLVSYVSTSVQTPKQITYAPYDDIPSPFEKLPEPVLEDF